MSEITRLGFEAETDISPSGARLLQTPAKPRELPHRILHADIDDMSRTQ